MFILIINVLEFHSWLDVDDLDGSHPQNYFTNRVQVSSIRYSRSDDKKFYIYTGTKTLHLRAEANADRSDWVGNLQAAKDMFPRDSLLIGLVTPSEEITISTEMLRLKLLEFGLTEEKVKECEAVMLGEFNDVKEQLKVMQQRRLTLLERLRMLEVCSSFHFEYNTS